MKYLLDTNTCVYFFNQTHPRLTQRLLREGPLRLAVSTLTIGELAFGAEKSGRATANRKRIQAFTDEVPVEPFVHDMALRFGEIKSQAVRSGRKVGDFDLAIAAVALVRGYTVVTHDVDFDRIPGLRTEDWTSL
jgi:tRNA(fMet)-specific endonuclease VapC